MAAATASRSGRFSGPRSTRSSTRQATDTTRWRDPGIRASWKPQLTVVPFRYVPGSGDADAANARLLDVYNASKRVFCRARCCRGNYICWPVHRQPPHAPRRIDETIQIVRSAAADL